MIEILNPAELPRARAAGALVAGILQSLRVRCEVGTNLLDVDRWARALIEEAGACRATSTTRRRSVAARSVTTSARRSTTRCSTASRTTTRWPTATC